MYNIITMDMFDSSLFLVLSNALLLLLLIVQNIRWNKKTSALYLASVSINNDVSALCRGATNIDRRLEMLANQIKRVNDKQEKLEVSDTVAREYDHAIRAIKNGATIDKLIDLHGLSQAEARLLVSIHADSCAA